MDETQTRKRVLLLVEPGPSGSNDLTPWLTDRGMRTWCASDVSHAIGELLDFTVRNRPDVVMLKASPIADCLRELTMSVGGLFGNTCVSVVAMSNSGTLSRTEPFFATNFAELETMIDREVGSPASI